MLLILGVLLFRLQDEKPESVQFMQFDVEGNLFVYEPGAGCSGVPRKIPQGFTQDDLDLISTSERKVDDVGTKCISPS